MPKKPFASSGDIEAKEQTLEVLADGGHLDRRA